MVEQGHEVGRRMEGAAHARAIPRHAQEGHRAPVHRRILGTSAPGSIAASAAARRCSSPIPSSTPAPAGRASTRRLAAEQRAQRGRHELASCAAPRSCAPRATRTWATCSMTAPSRPGLRYCMNSASLKFEPKDWHRRAPTAPRAMRVLLAEDDPMIGASVRRGLRQDGFAVDWVAGRPRRRSSRSPRACTTSLRARSRPAATGRSRRARRRCAARGDTRPVLIVDGARCRRRPRRRPRRRRRRLPGEAVRARPSSRRGSARCCGAARAAPRRSSRTATSSSIPATREVRLRGAPIALSPREFALLEALLARPGAILSRAQLEDKLYGWNEAVESNAVEVHIHALRRKLGADVDPQRARRRLDDREDRADRRPMSRSGASSLVWLLRRPARRDRGRRGRHVSARARRGQRDCSTTS